MARRPRDPQREQFWRQHVEQQRASGQSIRSYCSANRLREPSFYAWRSLLAKRDREGVASSPAFVPVAVVDAPPRCSGESPIDIRTTSGCRVRVRSGCDRQLLAAVLVLLSPPTHGEARPC
jgi:hypothetical protein